MKHINVLALSILIYCTSSLASDNNDFQYSLTFSDKYDIRGALIPWDQDLPQAKKFHEYTKTVFTHPAGQTRRYFLESGVEIEAAVDDLKHLYSVIDRNDELLDISANSVFNNYSIDNTHIRLKKSFGAKCDDKFKEYSDQLAFMMIYNLPVEILNGSYKIIPLEFSMHFNQAVKNILYNKYYTILNDDIFGIRHWHPDNTGIEYGAFLVNQNPLDAEYHYETWLYKFKVEQVLKEF